MDMTVIYIRDCQIKKLKIECGLKEGNGFVKNLKCKNPEMLIGPIGQEHIKFIHRDFQEEEQVSKQTLVLEDGGFDQVISQCSMI